MKVKPELKTGDNPDKPAFSKAKFMIEKYE